MCFNCIPEDISFSIIVPVFNGEAFIEKCIESIYPVLKEKDEILLSLGNSVDKSNEIAEKIAREKERVRVVYQDGKGLSNARNCAVQRAHGTYIVYIDGDDYVQTGLFEKALERIRTATIEYDLYVFDFYHYNCRSRRLEPWFQIGENNSFEGIEHFEQILHKRKCFWNVWRYIYRRDFLITNEISFLEDRMSEDVDYTTKVLMSKPKTAFFHDPYYIYVVGRGSSLMDTPTLRRLQDTLYVLKSSIAQIQTFDTPFSPKVVAQFQFEYVLNMALLYEIREEDRNEGKTLFKDAETIISGSGDIVVRMALILLRTIGQMPLAYLLHNIKKMKQTLQGIVRKRNDYHKDAIPH